MKTVKFARELKALKNFAEKISNQAKHLEQMIGAGIPPGYLSMYELETTLLKASNLHEALSHSIEALQFSSKEKKS